MSGNYKSISVIPILGVLSLFLSLCFFIATSISQSNMNAMHSCEKLMSTVHDIGAVYYDIDYNDAEYDSDGNIVSSESWDVDYYFDYTLSWSYGSKELYKSIKKYLGYDSFSYNPSYRNLRCDYYKNKIQVSIGDNYMIYVNEDGSFYGLADDVESSASKYRSRKNIAVTLLIVGVVLIVISGGRRWMI